MDKCCENCKWWKQNNQNKFVGDCVGRKIGEAYDEDYEDYFEEFEQTDHDYVCDEYEPKRVVPLEDLLRAEVRTDV